MFFTNLFAFNLYHTRLKKTTQNHCIEFTGITKEQAEQAVKMMPKDPKVLAGMVTDKLAGGKAALQGMGLPGKRQKIHAQKFYLKN